MASTTTPPGRHTILYDGHCRFCIAQSARLRSWARPGAIDTEDFQDPAVLARFPGLSHDACMKAMQLIAPDGRIFAGAEAIAHALATRPLFRLVPRIYALPGLRWVIDACYRWIAAHRYLFGGKATCESDSCSLHVPPR